MVIGSYRTLFGATLVATVVLVTENKLLDRKKSEDAEETTGLKNVPRLGTKK